MSCGADAKLLLAVPCEPGNCHIYFSVQRRAMPFALALARATGRTLVLPPFEWYSDQAQQYANAFRATDSGKSPRFTRWSELFDLPRLQQHADVVEWADVVEEAGSGTAVIIERALQQMGNQPDASGLAFVEKACKRSSELGLTHNLTWPRASSSSSPPPPAAEGRPAPAEGLEGELYGARVRVGAMRCGKLDVRSAAGGVDVARDWFGEARLVAAFDVGHHTHTKVDKGDELGRSLAANLRPHPSLLAEAARYHEEALAGVDGTEGRFVAVHWRHGDWVAYKLLVPIEKVVAKARAALDEMRCDDCPVFLMTNCRDAEAMALLADELPTLVTYAPRSEEFAADGASLVIEQAIAARATLFLGSPRSAVTQYVMQLRTGLYGADVSTSRSVG